MPCISLLPILDSIHSYPTPFVGLSGLTDRPSQSLIPEGSVYALGHRALLRL